MSRWQPIRGNLIDPYVRVSLPLKHLPCLPGTVTGTCSKNSFRFKKSESLRGLLYPPVSSCIMLREFEIQSWPDLERTGVGGVLPECWEAVGWKAAEWRRGRNWEVRGNVGKEQRNPLAINRFCRRWLCGIHSSPEKESEFLFSYGHHLYTCPFPWAQLILTHLCLLLSSV